MSDAHERLRLTLAELKAELASIEELDPETRDLLERTSRELHDALEAEPHAARFPGPEAAQPLQETLVRMEQSNPTLYRTVSNLLNALGELGI